MGAHLRDLRAEKEDLAATIIQRAARRQNACKVVDRKRRKKDAARNRVEKRLAALSAEKEWARHEKTLSRLEFSHSSSRSFTKSTGKYARNLLEHVARGRDMRVIAYSP